MPAVVAGPAPAGPRVSVIMANWQGERHLAAAMGSVLAQSMGDLELLVADDASTDASAAIVRDAAAGDRRVRWLPAAANGGPSAARNRALEAARGAWLAVVDSDDLLHPRRLEILLDAAERLGADMVADDMAFFGDGPGAGGRTLLGALRLAEARAVGVAEFVLGGEPGSDLPALGYLKPLIRREALGRHRYDPTLRVGEDFDLYQRLLLDGARLVLLPLPLYLYRRHGASISHRLSVRALEPLLVAHEALDARLIGGPARMPPGLMRAMRRRGRSLRAALRFERLVAALKARDAGAAAGLMLRHPELLGPLARSLRERLARRPGQPSEAEGPARLLLVPPGVGAVDGPDADAGREGRLEVPPIDAKALGAGLRLHDVVCHVTALGAARPIEVTAIGLSGLDGLGLVPHWRSAELWLAPGEAEGIGQLPRGVRIREAPLSSSAGAAGTPRAG